MEQPTEEPVAEPTQEPAHAQALAESAGLTLEELAELLGCTLEELMAMPEEELDARFNEAMNLLAEVSLLEDSPFAVDGTRLIAYNGMDENLVIPAELGVTAIDSGVFQNVIQLHSVVIEGNVTEIGNNAFSGCTMLESVCLPSSLTKIGSGAFKGCTALKSIQIPDGVTTIGSETFKDCSALQSVQLPKNLERISSMTFYRCRNLAGIQLPEGLTNIDSNAFNDCASLKSVVIPGSVDTIGDYAFRDCPNIASFKINSGVKKLGKGVFFWVAPRELEIPASVNSISVDSIFGVDSKPETLWVEAGSYAQKWCEVNGICCYVKGETPLREIRMNVSDSAVRYSEEKLLVPEIYPENATVSGFIWTSSDETVATVENGMVTAVGQGVVNITCASKKDPRISATCELICVPRVVITNAATGKVIEEDEYITLNKAHGEKLELSMKVLPESAAECIEVECANPSAANGVISIEGNTIYPLSSSGVYLPISIWWKWRTSYGQCNDMVSSFYLTVVDARVYPQSVKISDQTTIPIARGETLQLNPRLEPAGAWCRSYAWKSTAAKIATVDQNGLVRAVAEGSATISVATDNKKTAKVNVKVVDPYKPTAVRLDKTGTVNLNLGESLTLTPSLAPATAQATYTWKTSSTKIATVANGVVTPVGEGTATITVTATRGKVKKTASVKVKVVDPYKPTAVKLDKTGTVNLNLGTSLTLTPSLTPATAQATYTWKSSSTKIATVANGVVTPVGKGIATITVTATRGKVKKTAVVKVRVS